MPSPRQPRYRKIIERAAESSGGAAGAVGGFLRNFRRGYSEADLEYAEQVAYARGSESHITTLLAGENFDQLRIDLEQQRALGAPRLQRARNLPRLQKDFWDLWHIEPVVKNAVTMMTALITGGGVFIDVPEEQPGGVMLKKLWDDFDKKNRYSKRVVWKNIHDTLLMGEVVNWFDLSLTSPDERFLGSPHRVVTLDFISTGGIASVKTTSLDPLTPTLFERRGTFRALRPDEVTHWKAPAAGNQIHGRPVLESAYDDIWRIRQSGVTLWMHQEWLQRTFAFIYKITDPSMSDKLPESLPIPEGLEGIEIPAGVDLEIPALKEHLSAGGRLDDTPVVAPLLRVAQAIQLPYHILVMRFNEANFASLLSAEGPTVKVAEYWAGIFCEYIEADVRKIVGEDAEITVKITPTVMRDQAQERSSTVELLLANVIDMRSAREDLGFDHDEIEARMLIEREGEEEPEEEPEVEEDDEAAVIAEARAESDAARAA